MLIGIAHRDITPEHPVWLSGYAFRTELSTGVYAPLKAGAIYLEADDGSDRALILTSDHIGYSPPADARMRQALAIATGLLPRQIVLTATHTHCGPVISPWFMPGEIEVEYVKFLQSRLVEAAQEAMGNALQGTVALTRSLSTF
ncbi:uncharacterized protein METZ01_LOCUS389395, partial [marine metagenome]